MKFFVRDGKGSTKQKALLIMISIMALVVQPVYGLIASYIANAAPGSVVVRAASLQGWKQVGSGGSFSDAQAKIGDGSYRFTAGTAGQKSIGNSSFANTKLSDITELSYSSYVESQTGNVAGLVRIDTRLGNTNTTLVWEPAYGPQTVVGSWQDYNPLTQGKWWSTTATGIFPSPTQAVANMHTWSEIIAAYPTATVRSNSNGIYLSAGQRDAGVPWTNFIGYVDNFKFNGTTYDFEPVAPVPPATPANLRLNGDKICGYSTNVNSITPTWDAVTNAVSYNYKVVLPGGGVYGPVNVGNVTSITGPFGAQGTSTFSVQAVAANGLTSDWATPCAVSYDTTDPSFAITDPANGSFVRGIQTIKAQITDDSDITKVLMNIAGDSRSWTNGSSSTITRNGDIFSTVFDTTAVADGPVYVTLRGTDGAGNTRYWNNNSVNRQHVFTVDNTKPTVILREDQTIKSSGSYFLTSKTVRVQPQDTNLGKVFVNGVEYPQYYGSGSFGINWIISQNPSLEKFVITVEDKAGNVSDDYTVKIDRTVPTITLKTGTGINDGTLGTGPWYRQVSFKLYDKDKNLKEVDLNGHIYNRGGEWNDLNWVNITKSHLVQGENTIIVRDYEGNSSELKFFFDSVPPTTTTITSAHQDSLNNVSFTGAVSDVNLSYYYCWLTKAGDSTEILNTRNGNCVTTWANGETDINGTLGGFNVNDLDTGMYTIHLAAVDKAGNAKGNDGSITYDVYIDHTPPTISINNAFGGDITNKIFREVSFGYYDANKVAYAKFNGDKIHNFSDAVWSNTDTVWSNKSWTGVHEGLNTLELYDVAGNKATLQFTIDVESPEGVVTYSTTSLTRGNVTVTLKLSETATVLSAGWSATDDPLVFTKVFEPNTNTPANHEETVSFKDVAGNEGATSVLIDWQDNKKATVDITDVAINNITKTLTFNVRAADEGIAGLDVVGVNIYDENNSTQVIAIGRLTSENGTNSFGPHLVTVDISGLDSGKYTIRAAARDAVNTTDNVYETIQFDVDNTPPEAPEILVANANGVSGTAEPGAKVVVRVGNKDYETLAGEGGNWSVEFVPALAAGSHTIIAVATDDANNPSEESTRVVAVLAGNNTSQGSTNSTTSTPVAAATTNPNDGDGDNTVTNDNATADNSEDTDVLAESTTNESDSEGQVLAAQDEKGNWSIVNLVLAAFTVLLSLVALIGLARRNEEGEANHTAARIATLIPVAVAAIVFMLVEDLSASAIWFNWWTVLYAVVLAVQVAIVSSFKNSREY